MSLTRNHDFSLDAPSSTTALSVISAYTRAAARLFPDLAEEKEVALAQHVLDTAISSERDCGKKTVTRVVNWMPYFFQERITQPLLGSTYDEWIFTRKYMIRQQIEKLVHENSIDQILLLGSGYDPLGFILSHQFPQIQIFEVDRGYTYQAKIKALTTIPSSLDMACSRQEDDNMYCFNNNLFCIASDLAQHSISHALNYSNYSPFDKKKNTVVIAEGLTMYLSEEDIKKLLTDLKNNVLNESGKILISFLASYNDKSRTQQILRRSNEEYKFGILPAKVPEFVNLLGYDVASKTNREKGSKSAANAPAGEYYYLLKNAKNPQHVPIEDVDNMDVNLKRVERNSAFSCNIL